MDRRNFSVFHGLCLGAALAACGALAQEPPNPQLGRLSALATAPDWSQLQALSKTLTGDEFDAAFETFYRDERRFPPPWQRDAGGVTIPTGRPDGSSARIEFRAPNAPEAQPPRYWRKVSELPKLEGRPVLSDLKIALDPGHIGGSYAVIEERRLTFHPGNPQEAVVEGDHVLKVAQLLKPRLEALGAKVSLVRENSEPVTGQRPADLRETAISVLRDAGITNPKESYAGLSGDEKVLTIQWQTEKLFYRVSEIHARARKVNEELKPDVVVCMHLNAEPWGPNGQHLYSPVNHLHVLINGCYAADELQQQDIRFEMVRRLFLRAHDEELPLAEAVAKSMAESTGLPPYVYMTPNARLVSATGYVYARNLLANRIYECPVIYLEPYVMNNQDTYQRLLQGHYVGRTLTSGRLRSSIYEDYAQGILDGLVNHYRAKRS